MMFESLLRFDKIRSFDSDPTCAPIADTINRPHVVDEWKFKASTCDMLNMDYSTSRYSTFRANGSKIELEDTPDTLINTSCEHLSDYSSWWQRIVPGKLVILQSNDFYSAKEHCNCVKSADELLAHSPMTEVLFKGELSLPDYHRFMLIGYK